MYHGKQSYCSHGELDNWGAITGEALVLERFRMHMGKVRKNWGSEASPRKNVKVTSSKRPESALLQNRTYVFIIDLCPE